MSVLRSRPHFVYRCYAPTGTLLYVGCSFDVTKRLGQHRTFGTWTHAVARTDIDGPHTFDRAREIEREAIKTEDPLCNANTPRNLATSRRRFFHFHSVFHSAIDHGETPSEAARLALLAVESEELAAAP